MRLELTRVGLLVELANHYTTRGAYMYLLKACICGIVWIRQQNALVSPWTQIKKKTILLFKDDAISKSNEKALKIIDQFICLGSNI